MGKLSFYLAMLAGKTASALLKLLGRNASYLPGKVALTICKDFMGRLTLPKTVICVTGTNGKTTVSNLLTGMLREFGYTVTNNSLGSNVQAGVCTALLDDATFGGTIRKDVAVLEIDERSSLLIYPYIHPTYLVCNNIMRDSIKRNAHTDFISFILNKAIPADTKLILNADDIICAHLAPQCQDRTYFGISADAPESDALPFLRDIVYCPECGALLKAKYARYNHIGRLYCPDCSYQTPEPDFVVSRIDEEANTFTVTHGGEAHDFALINRNITNLYNFCGAITVLSLFGLSYEQLRDAFAGAKIVRSRYDEITVGDHKLTVILAKGQNPIACSGVIRYAAGCPGEGKNLLISLDDIGDNHNNSENVSWVFDTDYAPLADDSIAKVIFIGKRCHDYYLRALMAGVPEDRLFALETWQQGVDAIDLSVCKDVYLLYDPYRGAEERQIQNCLVSRMKGDAEK